MIVTRIGCALITRDALTGRPLSKEVLVTVDGAAARPEYRQGGYVLLLNLSQGKHEVTLRSPLHMTETITVTPDGGAVERIVNMAPRDAAPVTRAGYTRGDLVTVAFEREPELRLGQDTAAGDVTQWRVVCRAAGALPGLPAEFLIIDGNDSERSILELISGETGQFRSGFARAHKRGSRLLPCVVCKADTRGEVTARLRPGTAYVFDERRRLLDTADVPAMKGMTE
jgi:hypothetical protein